VGLIFNILIAAKNAISDLPLYSFSIVFLIGSSKYAPANQESRKEMPKNKETEPPSAGPLNKGGGGHREQQT
jgi:hypothetical protein